MHLYIDKDLNRIYNNDNELTLVFGDGIDDFLHLHLDLEKCDLEPLRKYFSKEKKVFKVSKDDVKLIKEMWDFYLKYCSDNSEEPFSNLVYVVAEGKIFEAYSKAMKFVNHAKIQWKGDSVEFMTLIHNLPIYFVLES